MSDTPRTDANKLSWDRANEAGCSAAFTEELERENNELRAKLADAEKERGEARTPICIGRPLIDILASEGQWLSSNGAHGLIAASDLFHKSPYTERDAAIIRAEAAEKERDLAIIKYTGELDEENLKYNRQIQLTENARRERDAARAEIARLNTIITSMSHIGPQPL